MCLGIVLAFKLIRSSSFIFKQIHQMASHLTVYLTFYFTYLTYSGIYLSFILYSYNIYNLTYYLFVYPTYFYI